MIQLTARLTSVSVEEEIKILVILSILAATRETHCAALGTDAALSRIADCVDMEDDIVTGHALTVLSHLGNVARAPQAAAQRRTAILAKVDDALPTTLRQSTDAIVKQHAGALAQWRHPVTTAG